MPLWQIAFVLLGAPALQWLLFVASGVTFATFSRFAFLAGMLTEYIAFAFVLLILRRAGMRLSDIGLNAERWGRDTLVGIGAGVVLFVVSGVLMVVIEPILPSTLSRDPRPPWAAVVYALRYLPHSRRSRKSCGAATRSRASRSTCGQQVLQCSLHPSHSD
jgi:hypothetical protein